MATRPLHFIWIADCSGSMGIDGKIQTLNHAIHGVIPLMQETARQNPNAQVLVRAIKFSNGAQWHVSQPTNIEDFKWTDLTANGLTDMGKALSMVADQLKIPPMSDRALPPVLVLLSDGQPTDDFSAGLRDLMAQPWGQKAVRIAIAIGSDTDSDVLTKFIGRGEMKPLLATHPDQLIGYIRWVSTAVLKAASAPDSRLPNNQAGPAANVPIPVAPTSSDIGSADHDVW